MRLFVLILFTAIVGTALGASLAYVEVGSSLPLDDLEPLDERAEGVASGPGEPKPAREPRLLVAEPTFDFGRMQRGTKRSHVFVMENVGTAPLRLEMGTPSCKCTVGELSQDVLQPGEKVEVDVTWKAQSSEGPFRQTVPFSSNDPTQSQIELAIEGQITEPTGLLPRSFDFGKIRFGEEKTSMVYVMAYLQHDIEITSASLLDESAREYFDIDIENVPTDELPDERATAGKRVTLKARAGLPIGSFTQWLTLETNLPDWEEFEIPVDGRVVGDISIHGRGWNEQRNLLRLGRVASSTGKKAELNIVVRGEHASDVEMRVAETDPPELIATLGKPRQLKPALLHIPLNIEVPAGTRPMARLKTDEYQPARIVLATSHPQAPQLALDVSFSVER